MPQETKQWLLASEPVADTILSGPDATFKLVTTTLPDLNDNQVLVHTTYLSNDPAQRGWIQRGQDPARSYTPPVAVNTPMRSYGVAEVVESTASNLPKGTLVIATTNWSEYAVLDAAECRVLEVGEGIKPTHFLGALGGTGLTAYYGLLDIARATKEDAVVVSGAAGATGSMVVQIAKHIVGCKRVIGIAGTDEKCRWVESLGADVCVNYKAASFKEDLWAATEGFVEVYFDNVGGEILDLMLKRLKKEGRVAACGSIANYNAGDKAAGLKNWFEITKNRLEIKGFIVTDAVVAGKKGAMLKALTDAVKEGKIKLGEEIETVVPTKFEDIPKTWVLLFSGGNQGKLVTQLV
ncbi:NAD(P)-binding protein [Mytilinidion resinicola]|uniref:NAD(P)-binding protein n=1 Tax=Mytilinidion resinicola TaxID=574789 RepID=A0A6A6YL18_9PEZI|nr:NAD(P)-binding protein [Mytilinidion resinicola]KAF2808665.1 NAD(P)-binding protein [Mytilinidion resinicola]